MSFVAAIVYVGILRSGEARSEIIPELQIVTRDYAIQIEFNVSEAQYLVGMEMG